MPSLYNYRLFISHAWRYGKDYDRLISFLDSAPYFSYYNYSAPKERPLFPEGTPLNNKMIASKITDKISPAQIVLVISGMYGAYSDWMGYEINEAVRLGKPILGIYPWGQTYVPQRVLAVADEMVHWNTDSIVGAIRRLVP